MKTRKMRGVDAHVLIPETPLEAVESLELFFNCDMWYTKHNEWKTEKDMLRYLKTFFKICKNSIKKIENKRNNNNI